MVQKPAGRQPKYRRQARPHSIDQAFVELGGARIYLGRYDSAESWEAYHRALAEWSVHGSQPTRAHDSREDLTVVELAARYWHYAERYYRKPDGTPTIVARVKMALKPVRKLYGRRPVREFGPNALRAVRQTWLDRGLARRTIRDYTAVVKHMFKWGVARELVPASVHQALTTVEGLRRNRSAAREPAAVCPAPDRDIQAVKQFVSRQVWGLIRLQLLTGARSGELVTLRPVDLDMDGAVWTYTPRDHKTAHHGHRRTIFIGPAGQEIIRGFLQGRPVDVFLFDPREAVTELGAKSPIHRRTDQPDSPRKTIRVVGDRYTTASYRRAITRGCKAADVPVWTPHRLRHTAATRLRRDFGIDVAQTVLGHRLGSMITELYAEANMDKAKGVIGKVG